MKAIGYKTSLAITEQDSFIEFEMDVAQPIGKDILVKIEAVSINPVDYKIRQSSAKGQVLDQPKVIGWDAIGVVESIGEDCELFKVGDRVFYAGDIRRPGTNAEFHLVDERIVGHAPKNISVEAAAAMPLTALTAWELMFDRMRISHELDKGKSILIIGGAGGVGSIAIQMAKKIAGLKVIATASRPETIDWAKKMGADVIVNHYSLAKELRSNNIEQVDYILDLVDANSYWDLMAEFIKPQGHIGSISDPVDPVALRMLKSKSVSFSWELMFTRSMFQTDDMIRQHQILTTVGSMLDDGIIISTLNNTIERFSVDSFKKVHAFMESGKAIGKTVIKF